MREKEEKQLTMIQNGEGVNGASNEVVKYSILPFFACNDVIAMSLTHHRLHFLSQDEYQFNQLLDYIDKGQYDAVMSHLERFPQILNHQVHQKRFISKCLEEGEPIRLELVAQYEEQMKDGVSYELNIGDNQPETVQGKANKERLIAGFKKLKDSGYIDCLLDEKKNIIKEQFFDLNPLINALQYYTDHYNEWDFDASRTFWVTVVGLLQTLLPAYIRQHHCDQNNPFTPPLTFKKEQFKRGFNFYNWISNKDESFDFSCLGLGLDFGIAWIGGVEAGLPESVAIDAAALIELFEKRTKSNLAALEEQLNQPLLQRMNQNQFGM